MNSLFRTGMLALFMASQQARSEAAFPNEPAARALYDQMIAALRKPETLSWVGDYRWEAEGRELGHATYRIWLKKPNYARMEAMPAGTNEPKGILIGDGRNFYVYWPTGKPRYGWENKGKYAEEYDKYQHKFYRKTPSPPRQHSLAHESGSLAAGMAMLILDPSTFHGYTDSLQKYIDAVRALPAEKVDGEHCEVLEVSIMKHQRSWFLWLARRDHLPRKLKQIIRVSNDIIVQESWSDVATNVPIADDRFAWSVPDGWKEWRQPEIEEGLLPPGSPAPDFELTSTDGRKIKLSNFQGKIVWLNKWRCG